MNRGHGKTNEGKGRKRRGDRTMAFRSLGTLVGGWGRSTVVASRAWEKTREN